MMSIWLKVMFNILTCQKKINLNFSLTTHWGWVSRLKPCFMHYLRDRGHRFRLCCKTHVNHCKSHNITWGRSVQFHHRSNFDTFLVSLWVDISLNQLASPFNIVLILLEFEICEKKLQYYCSHHIAHNLNIGQSYGVRLLSQCGSLNTF